MCGREEAPAATHLRGQVVPGGQVLEPEEAVPVPGAAPARVVLHHLEEGEAVRVREGSPRQDITHTSQSSRDIDQLTRPDTRKRWRYISRDTASPGHRVSRPRERLQSRGRWF